MRWNIHDQFTAATITKGGTTPSYAGLESSEPGQGTATVLGQRRLLERQPRDCQQPAPFWVAMSQPPVGGLTVRERRKYYTSLKIVHALMLSIFVIFLFQRWLEYSPTCLKPFPLVNTPSYTHTLYVESTAITLRKLFLHFNEMYRMVICVFSLAKICKSISLSCCKSHCIFYNSPREYKSPEDEKKSSNRDLESVNCQNKHFTLHGKKKSLCLTAFSTKPTNYLSVYIFKNYILILHCSYTTSNTDLLVLITCVHIAYHLHQLYFCSVKIPLIFSCLRQEKSET